MDFFAYVFVLGTGSPVLDTLSWDSEGCMIKTRNMFGSGLEYLEKDGGKIERIKIETKR